MAFLEKNAFKKTFFPNFGTSLCFGQKNDIYEERVGLNECFLDLYLYI